MIFINAGMSGPVVQVLNAAALPSVSDAGFTEGKLAYVGTYGDYFAWHPGQTLTTVANVIINGQSGQWVRVGIANPIWQAQTTWSVDESNVSGLANDENSGIDDAHPLLNIDEFVRRMGQVTLKAPVTMRWMSDTTHYTVNLSSVVGGINAASAATGGFPLIIIGLPTIVRTGTLTAATDAPWTVTDSSLPTSWSASGCLSTTSGVRLIRKTDGTKSAFMGYENVAKTASTSPTNNISDTFSVNALIGAAASFSAGDSYNVYSLPKFPRVTSPDNSSQGSFGVFFILLDLLSFNGGANQVRNCGMSGVSTMNMAQRGGLIKVFGAIFMSTTTMIGMNSSNIFDRIMTLATFSLFEWAGNLNGAVNVAAKAGSFVSTLSSFGRLGTIYAFDNTVANGAIFLNNNSNLTLDAVHGSGNTQLIVNIRDPGCSVNSQATPASFDATTSAAHPISVCGTQFDYANLPITSLISTKLSGFITS